MRKLLPLIISMLIVSSAFAQLDSKVTTGVIAYDQGDYSKAVTSLKLAMASPKKLKSKNQAKGWYYLGKASIANYRVEMSEYKTGDPVPDSRVVLQSMEAFQNGLDLEDEKYEEKLKTEMRVSRQLLLQLGLQYLNGGLAKDAIMYLNPAVELNDGGVVEPNHISHDLLAQCYLLEKDSVGALTQFKKGIDLIEKFPPSQGDVLCGYMAYRAALIKRYADNDNEAALALIRRGKELTGREWIRIGNGEANYTGDLKRIEDQHRNTMTDLKRFELDILINSGDHVDEALAKLKSAVEESPNEYILHVAYASLLEKVDINRAIAQYEKAITVDASEQMAHYNIAAIYVNQAVEISDRANTTTDMVEAESLSREVKSLFELALPHMRRALAAKPDDLGALNALIQITVFLGMTDEYNTYVQQRKLLTGQ